jgi:hypothetical protein
MVLFAGKSDPRDKQTVEKSARALYFIGTESRNTPRGDWRWWEKKGSTPRRRTTFMTPFMTRTYSADDVGMWKRLLMT